MIQNDTKEKVNDLVRFHEVLQEKLKTTSYSEQVLTLVPDKWSQYVLKCFKMCFNFKMFRIF